MYCGLRNTYTADRSYTEIAAWSRVLLEKLTVPQILWEFPAFHEKFNSMLCSQQRSICLSPNPDNCVLRPPILFT